MPNYIGSEYDAEDETDGKKEIHDSHPSDFEDGRILKSCTTKNQIPGREMNGGVPASAYPAKLVITHLAGYVVASAFLLQRHFAVRAVGHSVAVLKLLEVGL